MNIIVNLFQKLLSWKRKIFNFLGFGDPLVRDSRVKLLKIYPEFRPNSVGQFKDLENLTIGAIKNLIPALNSLTFTLEGISRCNELTYESFFYNFDGAEDNLNALDFLLNQYGSDKAHRHNYHYVYSALFDDRKAVTSVLEIGLGTSNTKLVSNMGKAGMPGASLRAWRDYFPSANIFGADIDRNILFEEERISTSYVDQLKQNTLQDLFSENTFDLVIDDGLHSPFANISTLNNALTSLKVGGWVVIEDISLFSRDIWIHVSYLISKSSDYNCWLVRANRSYLFLVRRVGV